MSKNAIVTGATSGIGEATAIALAEIGYNLIITGRRVERLRHLKKSLESEFGVQVETLCFDVRDKHQCAANLENLPNGFERIDVLVNNAGLAAGLEHIDQGDLHDWDAMIDTNVKGVLYVTRIISRKMIEAGGGHIVNIVENLLGELGGEGGQHLIPHVPAVDIHFIKAESDGVNGGASDMLLNINLPAEILRIAAGNAGIAGSGRNGAKYLAPIQGIAAGTLSRSAADPFSLAEIIRGREKPGGIHGESTSIPT